MSFICGFEQKNSFNAGYKTTCMFKLINRSEEEHSTADRIGNGVVLEQTIRSNDERLLRRIS